MNMIKDVLALARKNILQLEPYSSARSEFTGTASLFLDANENAFAEKAGENSYARYPDPMQSQLKEKIKELKQVSAGQVFIGNGSDEAIDLLFRIFCEPGQDKVMICPPTYGMYGVCARINNVEVVEVSLLSGFRPDTAGIMQAAEAGVKLLFLCSPNNPTGNNMPGEDMDFLLRNFPGIVVIDEAYADFSPGSSRLSGLGQYPNLVILQTLSKAWGMAALRLGMAFASENIISLFNKVKPPYNISGASQQAALEALENTGYIRNDIGAVIEQREIVARQLTLLPFVRQVFPSNANFLLVKVNDADQLYRYLCDKGIVVRNRNRETGCENCLRITIGTASQNQQLIKILQTYER